MHSLHRSTYIAVTVAKFVSPPAAVTVDRRLHAITGEGVLPQGVRSFPALFDPVTRLGDDKGKEHF